LNAATNKAGLSTSFAHATTVFGDDFINQSFANLRYRML
jgi:hypothetical protein